MNFNNVKVVVHPDFILHLTSRGHPEAPARYTAIISALQKAGLLKPSNTWLAPLASADDLLLCHSKRYIDKVAEEVELAKTLGLNDGSLTLSTGDVQICPASMEIALRACGAVLSGIDAIFSNQAARVFCPVRPPGHHACPEQGMGFCLFNNIAIGARYAQKKYGMKRVLIVDWDVHHGNGTQDIFWKDPSVFYFSTHQLGIYPGTGKADEKGAGNILNVPILGGAGARLKVLEAFRGKLVEAMDHFRPELVMISAGFDGHREDPLGGFDLSEEDFGELTRIVREVALKYSNGRILSVLEGGYDLVALGNSAVAHVSNL